MREIMKQQFTINEMEQIGRKCRRQHTDVALEIGQLSFKEIEKIEQDCRQQRSEAIANMLFYPFITIGARISAVASTLKTGGHGNKTIGATAR